MFSEAKDDGGGGDNWTTGAISRAKLQSNNHHQQTNIQYFYRPDALPVNQPSVKALKGKYPMDSPGGLSTLSLAVNSS